MGYLDPKPTGSLHKAMFFACGAFCGAVGGAGIGVWPLSSYFPREWFAYVLIVSAIVFGLYFGFLAAEKGDDFWPSLTRFLRWPWP